MASTQRTTATLGTLRGGTGAKRSEASGGAAKRRFWSGGHNRTANSLAAEAGEEGEDVFPGLEGVGAEMDKRTHKVLGAI